MLLLDTSEMREPMYGTPAVDMTAQLAKPIRWHRQRYPQRRCRRRRRRRRLGRRLRRRRHTCPYQKPSRVDSATVSWRVSCPPRGAIAKGPSQRYGARPANVRIGREERWSAPTKDPDNRTPTSGRELL